MAPPPPPPPPPYAQNTHTKTQRTRHQRADRLSYLDLTSDEFILGTIAKMPPRPPRPRGEIPESLSIRRMPQAARDDAGVMPYDNIVVADGSTYVTRDGCFVKCVLLEMSVRQRRTAFNTRMFHTDYEIRHREVRRTFIPFVAFESMSLRDTIRQILTEGLKHADAISGHLNLNAADVIAQSMCLDTGMDGEQWADADKIGTEYMNIQELLLLLGHVKRAGRQARQNTLYIHDGPLAVSYLFPASLPESIAEFIRVNNTSIMGQEKGGRVADHVFDMALYEDEYCILDAEYMRRHVLQNPTAKTRYGSHLYGMRAAVGCMYRSALSMQSAASAASDGQAQRRRGLPSSMSIMAAFDASSSSSSSSPAQKTINERIISMIPYLRGTRYDASLKPIEMAHMAAAIPAGSRVLEDMVNGRR